MRTKTRRTLAWMLSILMCLSLLPGSVLAAEEEEAPEIISGEPVPEEPEAAAEEPAEEPVEEEPAETPEEPSEEENAEIPEESAEEEPAETPEEPAEEEPAETPEEPAEEEPAKNLGEPAGEEREAAPADPVEEPLDGETGEESIPELPLDEWISVSPGEEWETARYSIAPEVGGAYLLDTKNSMSISFSLYGTNSWPTYTPISYDNGDTDYIYVLEAGESYELQITGIYENAGLEMRLSLLDTSKMTALLLGEVVRGNFENEDDSKWLSFTAPAEGIYEFIFNADETRAFVFDGDWNRIGDYYGSATRKLTLKAGETICVLTLGSLDDSGYSCVVTEVREIVPEEWIPGEILMPYGETAFWIVPETSGVYQMTLELDDSLKDSYPYINWRDEDGGWVNGFMERYVNSVRSNAAYLQAGTKYIVSIQAGTDVTGSFSAGIRCMCAEPFPTLMTEEWTEAVISENGGMACLRFTAETAGLYSFQLDCEEYIHATLIDDYGSVKISAADVGIRMDCELSEGERCCLLVKYDDPDMTGRIPLIVRTPREYSGLLWMPLTSGSAIITGYTEALTGALEIPEEIESYTVTEIGERAFYQNETITSVIVPASVTKIGHWAFSECTALLSAVLPDGITEIKGYTFANSTQLNEVTIPASVKEIQWEAFYSCENLEIVHYGGSPSQWNSIYIDGGNDALFGITPEYGAEDVILTPGVPQTFEITQPEERATFSFCPETTGIYRLSIEYDESMMNNGFSTDCRDETGSWVEAMDSDGYNYTSLRSYFMTAGTRYDLQVYTWADSGVFTAEIHSLITEPFTALTLGVPVQAQLNETGDFLCMSFTVPADGDYGFIVETDGYAYAWILRDNGRYYKSNNGEGNIAVFSKLNKGETCYCCVKNATGDSTLNLTAVMQTAKEADGLLWIPMGGDAAAVVGFTDNLPADVIIPSKIESYTVTEIDNSAFDYCKKMTSVFLPESVERIGRDAFAGCSNLADITLPTEMESIGSGAFQNCSSLTAVVLPKGIRTIDNWLFSSCSSLTEVTIPASVKEILYGAFYNCDSLTTVTFDGSLGQWKRMRIEEENDPLYSAKIICAGEEETYPEIKLDETAFAEITEPGAEVVFRFVPQEDGIYFFRSDLNGWNANPCGALYDEEWEKLAEESYGGSYGNFMFSHELQAGRTYYLYIYDEYETTGSIPVTVTMAKETGGLRWVVYEPGYAKIIGYTDALPADLVIPETLEGNTVSQIDMGAFMDCEILQTLVISRIGYITHSAFANCVNLRAAVLPEGMYGIGNSAFFGCTALESITLPKSLNEIEEYVFDGCTALEEIHYGGSPRKWNRIWIGDHNEPLYSAKLICAQADPVPVPLTLNEPTTAIITPENEELVYSFTAPTTAEYVFSAGVSNNNGNVYPWLQLCNIEYETIAEIGGNGASLRRELEINETVYLVITDSNGFNYGRFPVAASSAVVEGGLRWGLLANGAAEIQGYEGQLSGTLTIPSFIGELPVVSIGTGAFDGCVGITGLNLPETVTSIGNYAFHNCTGLLSADLPGSVAFLGNGVFSECSSLKSASMPGVGYLSYGTFYDCASLESFAVPEGCNEIGGEAFSGCTALKSISIPVSIRWIESNAFRRCGALKDVWYDGSPMRWNSINISSGNDALLKAELHCAAADPVIRALTLNQQAEAVIEEGTGIALFSFTPAETKTYYFTSLSENDTYGTLYYSSWSQMREDDDSGDGNNFLISAELYADTTYYLQVRFYSSGAGSFPVIVTDEAPQGAETQALTFATFDELKALAEKDYEGMAIFRYNGPWNSTFTIARDLAMKPNQRIEGMWNATVIVPAGVTASVYGLQCGRLVNNGTLTMGYAGTSENGSWWNCYVSYGLENNGTLYLAGWVNAEGYEGSGTVELAPGVSADDARDAYLRINWSVYSRSELDHAIEVVCANTNELMGYDLNLSIYMKLNSDLVIPEGVIVNVYGGLIVPAGRTLTVDGELQFYNGGCGWIRGALVNNGFIYVNARGTQYEQPSSLTMDGGSLTGDGTFSVTVSPEDDYTKGLIGFDFSEYNIVAEDDENYYGPYRVYYISKGYIPTVTVTGVSLTLKGQIGIYVYAQVPEEAVTARLTYPKTGEVKTFALDKNPNYYVAKTDQYKFLYENVPAKEMTQPLVLEVFDANGNALPIVHSKLGPQGTKFTCQAVDYCKTIIENPDQPEKLKDLVKAILNYGQCAQIQFGYDLDHLANPEGYLAEEMKTVEADPANNPVIPSNAADVGWEYGTLTLKGAVSANLYFSKQITAKDASGKTYTVKAKSGKWCITFDNIPAKNLGDKYTVVASYGGKTATIQYSALSYINAVLGNPNQPENLKELCKAMILYNKYAKAYFGN